MKAGRPPIAAPFFYGWVVLAVSMVGCFLAAATNQIFMGVMLKPISDDLGWSRTATSGAFTAGTILAGVASALIGPVVDRYGQRLVMPLGALFSGVFLWLLAGMDSVVQFYAFYLVARVTSQATMAGVAPTTAMANWFLRRRGRAMGLVNMSLPLGGSVFAFAAPFVMATLGGWRAVFAVSCVLTAAMAAPGALLLRRRPEDVGLVQDGGSLEAAHRAGRAVAEGPQFTLVQALRTASLWSLISSQFISAVAISTFGFHQSAYYTDQGLSLVVATASVSVYGLAGAFSSTLWGFLSERFNERWLAIGALLTAGAVMLGLALGSVNEFWALVASLVMGFTGRGQGSLFSILLARYYGRASYGAISGFIVPFQMTGLGLGPVAGSAVHDVAGSYTAAFLMYLAFYWVAVVCVFFAREPKPPRPEGRGEANG